MKSITSFIEAKFVELVFSIGFALFLTVFFELHSLTK